MKKNTKNSGGKYYALAVLVFAIGILAVVLLTANLSRSLSSGNILLAMPGKADLTLSKPGTYVIFYEYKSTLEGKTYSTPKKLEGIHFSLKDKAAGREVQLTPPLMNNKYSFRGHSGAAILQFDIQKPGSYELSGQYQQGKASNEIVVAVGRGVTGKLLMTIMAGMLILIIGTGGAIFLAAIGYDRTHGGAKVKKKR